MNKIIISGNLTKDGELSFTSGKGTAINKFCVAVARGYKQEDGTDFINCVLMGKRAESIANYLTKGTKVLVEGALRIKSYDKKDGTKGYSTEVLVSNVELLGSNNGHSGGGQANNQDFGQNYGFDSMDMAPVKDDEIPF